MLIEKNKKVMRKKLDSHIKMKMGVKRGVIQMEIMEEKITQMKIMEEKHTLKEEQEDTQIVNTQAILEELQDIQGEEDTQAEEEEETQAEVEVDTHIQQHITKTYCQC